jgi:hypothetical protein
VTALIVMAVVVSLPGLVASGHDGHDASPSPAAAPCVSASPHVLIGTPDDAGSPVASPDATPAVPSLGTPVSQSCLTVTLSADTRAAGPRTLTVDVVDTSGAPVTDAEVVVNTRSLVMDHGVSTNQAQPTEPGHYVVENVPMGMAGAWQAEVVITQPGQAPVTVIFVVELEGPA